MRGDLGKQLADERPAVVEHAVEQASSARVRHRVAHGVPAAEHDRRAARQPERRGVCGRIDADRTARDDAPARSSDGRGEQLRDGRPVGGGVACSHDRHARTDRGRRLTAPCEQHRRVEFRPALHEHRRVRGVADQRDAHSQRGPDADDAQRHLRVHAVESSVGAGRVSERPRHRSGGLRSVLAVHVVPHAPAQHVEAAPRSARPGEDAGERGRVGPGRTDRVRGAHHLSEPRHEGSSTSRRAIASATCSSLTVCACARSAMVRATRRQRSCARADAPSASSPSASR